MDTTLYAHRYADIILNSDYALYQEILDAIAAVMFEQVVVSFSRENEARSRQNKQPMKGKQATINTLLRNEFSARGWETEKNVFNDPGNDLALDFWKRNVGVDVAFNHRSFIGGDLLRLQAAAEVKHVIKVGVYICPTRDFARQVSPKDASSMVNFERTR